MGILGEIKEKKTAHREYREAISKGHGAYLMDEEEPVSVNWRVMEARRDQKLKESVSVW